MLANSSANLPVGVYKSCVSRNCGAQSRCCVGKSPKLDHQNDTWTRSLCSIGCWDQTGSYRSYLWPRTTKSFSLKPVVTRLSSDVLLDDVNVDFRGTPTRRLYIPTNKSYQSTLARLCRCPRRKTFNESHIPKWFIHIFSYPARRVLVLRSRPRKRGLDDSKRSYLQLYRVFPEWIRLREGWEGTGFMCDSFHSIQSVRDSILNCNLIQYRRWR